MSTEGNLLLGLADQSVALGLETLLTPLTESLVFGTLGIHLLLEDTLTVTLSLGLLDLFRNMSVFRSPYQMCGNSDDIEGSRMSPPRKGD